VTITAPPKYDPRTVPATEVRGVSRYLLGSTPTGIAATPTDTALVCWGNLLAEAHASAERLLPEVKRVALKRLVATQSGSYQLINRGTLSRPVTLRPRASGKFVSLDGDGGGSILDRVFLGDDRIRGGIRDEVLWEAALEFATAHRLDGEQLRRLSDLCALYLCLQAGIEARREELP
jgi:hypothetical protein